MNLFVRMSRELQMIKQLNSVPAGQDILCIHISVLLSVCESQILSFILRNLPVSPLFIILYLYTVQQYKVQLKYHMIYLINYHHSIGQYG